MSKLAKYSPKGPYWRADLIAVVVFAFVAMSMAVVAAYQGINLERSQADLVQSQANESWSQKFHFQQRSQVNVLSQANIALGTSLDSTAKALQLARDEIQRLKAPRTPAKAYTSTESVERWRDLVAKYFPPGQVNHALRCMKSESGGNPNAVSRTDDHGLFQIHNGLAIWGKQIYDPEFNIKLAYEQYYKPRGWSPWFGKGC